MNNNSVGKSEPVSKSKSKISRKQCDVSTSKKQESDKRIRKLKEEIEKKHPGATRFIWFPGDIEFLND